MSKWTGWSLLLCFLFFPDAVKNGIAKGLELGGTVLVPSIFPYLVASGILVKTGALEPICKKIRIGNLSQKATELLIPSLFCGYPTGARLSAMAYDNGSIIKKEFCLLFCYANIPGFGFAASYLGGLFRDTFLGVLIYLCFLFSSLTLIWISARRLPKESFGFCWNQKEQIYKKGQKIPKGQKISEALVESVSESAPTMISLLFFVCFFSSLIELLKTLPLPLSFFPIGASFLEITTGIFWLAKSYPIETVVFFCGFSGLSVIFQSLYFDKKHTVNFLRLLLWRTVYGILSVCYFWVLRFLWFLLLLLFF